jgi:hypothetical protein
MTGHSIRVAQFYSGHWMLEAHSGDPFHDPVRAAVAWTMGDACESFHVLIDAMKYPL